MTRQPHYTLKPKTTPLPSHVAASRAEAGVDAASKNSEEDPAFFRAANEDDDGYDPYSDRQEKVPFFEEDPWK